MMHTFYTCDWCGEVPQADTLIHTLRVGEKLHDFCHGCHTKITDRLDKTGRAVSPLFVSGTNIPYWQQPYYIGAQVPGSNLTGSTTAPTLTGYSVSMGVTEPNSGGTSSTGS